MVLSQMKLTPVWVEKESVTEGLLMDVTSLVAREVFVSPGTEIALRQQHIFPLLSQQFQENGRKNGLLVVKNEAGEMVALVAVLVDKLSGPFRDVSNEEVARIAYLMVEPSWRGCGIASELVRCCEEWAACRGFTSLYLFAYSEKKHLQHWYSKLGYVKVADELLSHPVPFLEDRFSTLRTKPLTNVL
ncbi:unnamed protein product [Durusdinium trenchii]|uniref:Uncharacterized protein n=2 Tax=Durusdinium trenchii TaxID=1381693 RepID=A0ABP0SQK3_9DINO